VKWVGGKTNLVPELLARAPTKFGRYFEPFAGGAALFFALRPERAQLADVNADLMDVYRAVAGDTAAVIRGLRQHAREHSSDHFYATRSSWNARRSTWTLTRRAAAFIYLNKTCFNGLWRVNRAGNFNVPMGRYTDPPICVPDALHAASEALGRAELRTGDFRETVRDAKRGDFVYFDPPYHRVSSTANFTSYTAETFGRDDQIALADTARRLVARGCHVVISNSDTPFVRALYAGFSIDQVRCSRSINSVVSQRGDVDELVIVERVKPTSSPNKDQRGWTSRSSFDRG
jgi:DNA adenine methylase